MNSCKRQTICQTMTRKLSSVDIVAYFSAHVRKLQSHHYNITDCPAGYAGTTYCHPCPDGTYANMGDLECTPCSQFANTGGKGQPNITFCSKYP